MRQIAILALIILAVAAATTPPPMKINCTHLKEMHIAYNFYMPPMECAKNDTSIKACLDTYDTCIKPTTTTCATGLGTCLSAKLRCFEMATPSSSACTSWLTMFSNEKLYITAGGDYNGSSLELSCRMAVCDFEHNKSSLNCSAEEQNVCKDALAMPPSTIPPAGKTVVTFTIGGDKQKFILWLAKDKQKAFAIISRILAKILETDVSNIVIIDAKAGSLTVDFYTTDDTLDVATVTSRMVAAKDNANQAQYFSEIAADSGIDISTMNISAITVSQATDAPAPGTTPTPDGTTPTPVDATPTPLAPGTASAVATALAVVATVAAMLF